VFFIQEDLWHSFNPFADSFFQTSFGDALIIDINVTEVEIVTLFSQFFRQLFGTDTIRAARTPENDCKHTMFLRTYPIRLFICHFVPV